MLEIHIGRGVVVIEAEMLMCEEREKIEEKTKGLRKNFHRIWWLTIREETVILLRSLSSA